MDSARTEGCVGVGQRRTVISWRIATLANAAVISNPTLPVLLSAAFRAFHERAASPRFARVGSRRVQTKRRVAMLNLSVPALSTAGAFLFLDEDVNAVQVLGVVIVMR